MTVSPNDPTAAALYSLAHLHDLRRTEMAIVLARYGGIFAGADILEIGAGTGLQLALLRAVARSAQGVDLPDSNYRNRRSAEIIDYDGVNLPFPAAAFDVVFSSNTMEHVLDEPRLHREMRRVLKPGGVAIHVVPSAAWRLWTMAAHYPAGASLLLAGSRGPQGNPPIATAATGKRRRLLDTIICHRHGERGNRFTEWWHFRAAAWRTRFAGLGWTVEAVAPTGFFYTGYGVAAERLSMARRQQLARLLGSACWICVLRPPPAR